MAAIKFYKNVVKHCKICRVEKPGREFPCGTDYREEACKVCRTAIASSRQEALRASDKRAQRLISTAKIRAKQLGVPFDLDEPTHLQNLKDRVQAGTCELSGIALNFAGKRTFDSPSLDRIEAGGGYTIGNVRIVCWAMNSALGTWGEGPLKIVMESWLGIRTGAITGTMTH